MAVFFQAVTFNRYVLDLRLCAAWSRHGAGRELESLKRAGGIGDDSGCIKKTKVYVAGRQLVRLVPGTIRNIYTLIDFSFYQLCFCSCYIHPKS